MSERLKFFVNGAWHDTESNQYMPVTNSSTGNRAIGNVLSTRRARRSMDVEIGSVAAAYPAWRDTPSTYLIPKENP
jgi:acyl-CoA reductase-like NAD-dependent aldehyde dehydrogenase